MSAGEELVRFTGAVECRVDRAGPLGLTLVGAQGDATVQAAFLCPAPPDFPARLDAPVVERAGSRRYRIVAAGVPRIVEAAVFVHRDVTHAFARLIPARKAPAAKRAFWRAVLAFAGTRAGQRVLFALRR
ncbi:MAG TPA: hypothetical protein VJ011_10785 [Steroidobacteraceae bacterium]|nr:hypothetical protein [Steroidobacteraceae bacterium]